MCLVRLCLPVTCANAKFFFPLELQVTLGLPLKYISSFVPSRRLHAAVCFSFGGCGSSTVFYGAGCWSKHSTGQHWCMEAHLSKAGRDRLLQLHGEHFLFFFCLRPFSVYVHVPVCSDKAAVVWQLTCFFQVWVSKVAPGSVFLISSPSLIWPQSCITCHRLYHLSVNTLAKLHVCVYTHAHPCCNMRKVVCCASVLAVDCVTSWGKHRVPKNVFVRTHNRNLRVDSLWFL